jgi:hypothetical protein
MSVTTRRQFLTAAPAAALAVATGTVAATPAPTPTNQPKKPHKPTCGCAVCKDDRRPPCDDVVHARSLVELARLQTALNRYTVECHNEHGNARFVDALTWLIERFFAFLEGEIISPEGFRLAVDAARKPNLSLPAADGLVVALFDALDALLDHTTNQCDSSQCISCWDADEAIHFVDGAVDEIDDLTGPSSEIVLARTILHGERAEARLASLASDEVLMMHSAAANDRAIQRRDLATMLLHQRRGGPDAVRYFESRLEELRREREVEQ